MGRLAGTCLMVVLTLVLCGSASAASSASIALQATPRQVQSGQVVTITGQTSGVAPGSTVTLYSIQYPYSGPSGMYATDTGPDGSFSFTVTPDRNTRYQAVVAGTDAQAQVQVNVTGRSITKVVALPLGRAEVTLVVFHPRDFDWGDARVQWWFASGRGAFRRTASTRTQELSPYVTALRTVVALPAGKFSFRACFHASDEQALVDPNRPPGCSGRGYQGRDSLPVGFPGPAAVGRARSYLARRAGRTAFAVVDSEGRLAGVHVHWRFPTASVVKAMLLTAYLRRLNALGRRHVDPTSQSFLYPMIHISDNNAATRCWSIVGDRGLYAVARAAGMRDFSVSGLWGTALLSPSDQARFFFKMDQLIPRQFVGYARFLLSTIDPSQSWAIPQVARPRGYKVFFKDGSEPTGLGQLVHQVARLEGHRRTIAMAIMTDGDPTMAYGIATIAGVARSLLS
jgi:hypothetical protein